VRPRASVPPVAGGRLAPVRRGRRRRDAERLRFDAWFEADIIVVPLADDALALARALAAGRRPGVADRAARVLVEEQIWIARPLGRAVADAPLDSAS